MKKIMLAAVAASFMSTGAQAVQLPAEGEVCSSIHSNISVGINNPELSDYRKCVMIQHEIDTAFTYKTFWVRTGTEFTSFAVEDLAKMNRSERVEYIKNGVTQEIVTKLLEEQREELEKAHMLAIVDLANAHADEIQMAAKEITRLAGQIEDINKALNEVDRTNAKVEIVFQAGVNSVEPVETIVYQDRIEYRDNEFTVTLNGFYANSTGGFNTGSLTLTVDQDGTMASLDLSDLLKEHYRNGWNDNESILKQAIIDELGLEGVDSSSAIDVIVQKIVESMLPGTSGPTLDLDQLRGLAHSNPVSTEKRDFDTEPVNANDYVTFDDEATARDATTYNMTQVPFGDGNFVTITVNGHDVFSFITSNDSVSFETIDDISRGAYDAGFNDGFEAGYKSGYDDGYKDGYADGYTDGFNDGVASVR